MGGRVIGVLPPSCMLGNKPAIRLHGP
ncbi:hypothetical protein RSAG8_02722, partial [Rhizoctonia solani AG-8 WAC10335]